MTKSPQKQAFLVVSEANKVNIANCGRLAGAILINEVNQFSGDNHLDIATLLHSLTVDGLTLRRGDADALEVAGELKRLTLSQQQALRAHKPTLLKMLPPPTCFIQVLDDERDAIRFADTPEALAPLADAIEYFERQADAMRLHNPEALAQVLLEPKANLRPCQRCGNDKTYLAIIHAGESLRRDCAQCGRLIDFPAWHNRELAGEILTRTMEQSRYNTIAGCSSAANTRATLTTSLYNAKETR
ncbi:MAG: hypothetical protein ABL888_11265 [Pirellulaceae bacterium]